MEHTTIRGKIRYTSKKKEILDKVRGGEHYTITVHTDGRRTLRAHCSIDENSPRVLRDCIQSYDANWGPTEAFNQLTVDEQFVGSAWYRFTDTYAECEGYTVREGRFSHRMEYDRRPCTFGSHPIQADAMHCRNYDLSKGPGEQTSGFYLMTSFHHRGADGPTLLKRPNGMFLVYMGDEKVTVGAGTFNAHHFRIGKNNDDNYMGSDIHPPYHLWTSTDGNYIMYKSYCTGYMQTYYELVELEIAKNFIL
jgi:hypothetical protein